MHCNDRSPPNQDKHVRLQIPRPLRKLHNIRERKNCERVKVTRLLWGEGGGGKGFNLLYIGLWVEGLVVQLVSIDNGKRARWGKG